MRRADLLPDCGSCAAICCVATYFEKSEDFAFDKAAGARCVNLAPDHRCRIHEQLAAHGFRGCALYDCYGAGQRVTRAFANRPGAEKQRSETFLVLREVHELLWFVTEAAKLCPPSQVELARELELETRLLDELAETSLAGVDLRPRRTATHALLRKVGTAIGGRRRFVVVD